MALLIKLAGEKHIPLPEILFWRQFLTVPLILGYLALIGQLDRLKTDRLGLHASRSVIGMTGMVFNFSAVLLLPLAESTTLSFTTPLFAVIIAATLFRQHIGPWRWTAVALGFSGVLVIAQPGHAPISPLGGAAGLASALTIALISFLIRSMGRTEEPLRIVFYFALFGALMMGTLLPFYWTSHDLNEWLLMGGIGLAGMSGQLFVTASLRNGAVASVIIMDYTSLIWATFYGWLIWDHLPSAATWLGAPLIVGAGLLIAWREQRLSRQPARSIA
jgi:drug/metabolite transporter (DMT)-like permease